MTGWLSPEPTGWAELVDRALLEDIGTGDLTGGCFESSLTVEFFIEAQATGIACGVGIAAAVFGNQVQVIANDGDRVQPGTTLLSGNLEAAFALSRERTALNFLMHLSGIASLTNQFVKAVAGTQARIIDTRKTIPGLRSLQKYAVRCGGGSNHRMGLYDAAMIKDNHIQACGSITAAVGRVRGSISHMAKIEVECESLEQVAEAASLDVDVIMLDNMPLLMMREAVVQFPRARFEASGGVNLETVAEIAQTGVHFISVGALTHSAPALAIHLEFS
ncbi:MAG: carboxylating nicotinate-nucleotide diphosphorylase [Fimbriimonadaceae bacterium]